MPAASEDDQHVDEPSHVVDHERGRARASLKRAGFIRAIFHVTLVNANISYTHTSCTSVITISRV